ncbi:MAG: serine/threonine protein kinase [Candidatus Obscuribacterales bacterium]|nr:serine/threonine protein kinase [Candidatus Obscuribacterales bacterium]
MAERSVVTRYESSEVAILKTLLKLSFPVWGLAMPIGAALGWAALFIGLLGFLSFKISGYPDMSGAITSGLFESLAAVFVATAIPISCLMLSRLTDKTNLIIDKNGIQLPLLISNPAVSGKYIPWTALSRIDIDSSEKSDWKERRLVLFRTSGGPIMIDMFRFAPEDVEKMLMSFELWSESCEISPEISVIKAGVKQLADKEKGEGMSYTSMWEEELQRRYCPTSFLPIQPGRTLKNGSIEVLRHLALGGLSAVYLVQLDGKELAVMKEAVIPEETGEGIKEKAKELFEREAELLMKLNHPGIVKVRDYFMEDERNYLLIDYLNGQDIQQLVKQNGPRSEIETIGFALQIASIMKYLHEQDPPVIHRDLTPDNLVVTEDGSIVVIDFGAANEFIGKATGTLVGKQAYISPEQFRGKACPESDIYAFGCTLFYMLTGQEPEALSTSSPRCLKEDVSEELNELVECCTQMEAEDRYRSAAQLLPVLRKLSAASAGV